jgi:hypothetical protein
MPLRLDREVSGSRAVALEAGQFIRHERREALPVDHD